MRVIVIALLGLALMAGVGCKRKGCTDPKASNYDPKAKRNDGSCIYPVTFNMNPSTGDGDITSAGGSGSNTIEWYNPQAVAEYAMDITTATRGSFRLIIKDAVGKVVLDRTLTKGVGDDSASGCTLPGTAGTWTITIEVTNFDGDASYTVDPAIGC